MNGGWVRMTKFAPQIIRLRQQMCRSFSLTSLRLAAIRPVTGHLPASINGRLLANADAARQGLPDGIGAHATS
jgi:hypothetical protein